MKLDNLFFILIIALMVSCSSEQTSAAGGEMNDERDSISNNKVVADNKSADSTDWNFLRMAVKVEGDTLHFRYTNTGEKRFCLWTETEGYGLTWNYVEFMIDDVRRVDIEFDSGEREHPGMPDSKWLAQGESYSAAVNFQEVLKSALELKKMNIPAGTYRINVHYDSSKGPLDKVRDEDMKTEHWNGKISVQNLLFTKK